MTYYTYAHLTPQGEIFYIGKGIADRAYSFADRSHNWRRAVKQNKGVQIEILANWGTEEEAKMAQQNYLKETICPQS